VLRDQAFLLPPNTADWLPDKHLVWFVLDVVAQLDTAAFHATRKTGGVGRQGYDPDMLLALMFYAYSVGERSSRRIERLCTEHVAFRILCGQDASRWPLRLGPKLIRWVASQLRCKCGLMSAPFLVDVMRWLPNRWV
jgi:hypothetical protein